MTHTKTNLFGLLSVPLILAGVVSLSSSHLIAATGEEPAPVPAVYEMFDSGEDFQATIPEAGPIGGVVWSTWEDIHTGPGCLTLTKIDVKLDVARSMTVTLSSGEVVSKPVVIQIFPYLSSTSKAGWTAYGWDATPGWVYRKIGDRPTESGRLVGHRLTCGGSVAVVPAYDSYTWRSSFAEMVALLGDRYDDDPIVEGIVIATGIDGETQPIKAMGGINWTQVMNDQAPGNEYRFSQFWRECVDRYADAFPDTPVWLDNAAGGSGTRRASTEYAAAHGIGIQISAMVPDIDSWQGYGEWWGLWDGPRFYSDTLSVAAETRMGYGSDEVRYWTLLAGLSQQPDVMMVHPDYIRDVDPAFLGWVNEHLAGINDPAVSAWTVLRDMEYPLVMWGDDGASGHPGDWVYGLQRVAGGDVIVPGEQLPAGDIRSRQARRTDQINGDTTITFQVIKPLEGDRYYFRMWYVDNGIDLLSVKWNGNEHFVIKRDSGEWREITIELFDYEPHQLIAVDCKGDGDEALHMAELLVSERIGPTQTPTTASPTATASPTPSRTATPSATATSSATATRTATLTLTPGPTRGPVYSALSAICDNCRLLYDGDCWIVPLTELKSGEELVPIGERLWGCPPGCCVWTEIRREQYGE